MLAWGRAIARHRWAAYDGSWSVDGVKKLGYILTFVLKIHGAAHMTPDIIPETSLELSLFSLGRVRSERITPPPCHDECINYE